MEVVEQTLEEILDSLSPLDVDWLDDTARSVIERLRDFPIKEHYTDAAQIRRDPVSGDCGGRESDDVRALYAVRGG